MNYTPHFSQPSVETVEKIFGSGRMKLEPRCARSIGHDPEPNNFPSGPTTQSIRTQYFGFVRPTFITHDVIERGTDRS